MTDYLLSAPCRRIVSLALEVSILLLLALCPSGYARHLELPHREYLPAPAESLLVVVFENHDNDSTLAFFIPADSAGVVSDDSLRWSFAVPVEDSLPQRIFIAAKYRGYTAFTAGAPIDLPPNRYDTGHFTAAVFDSNRGAATLTAAEITDSIWSRDTSDIQTGIGAALRDTAAYQGAASGLTAAEVADSVWNTPFTETFEPGSLGDSLTDPVYVQGSFSGTGPVAAQIAAVDSDLPQVIPGANIAIRNLDQSALLAVTRTGTNGLATANLEPDSVVVIAAAPGYLFDPRTVLVTPGKPDTVFGARFDPGEPSAPDLCRVHGYLYRLDGTPETDAVVTATLPAGVRRAAGIVVSPFAVSTATDSTGYFALDLFPGNALTPPGSPYEIAITRSDGTILRQRVTVPDSISWQLTW